MLRRVRRAVREVTRGRQIPWMASTLESEFYFRPLSDSDAVSLNEALGESAEASGCRCVRRSDTISPPRRNPAR
jgi:uncharacterized caspase-like protein